MVRAISMMAFAVAMLCTGAAWAQTSPVEDAQDWQLIRATDKDAVFAVAEFDNGMSLVSRCVEGDFEVTVHGLPEARGASRILRVSVGDEDLSDETWSMGDRPTVAFSRLPAPLARRLAKGGKLQIVVPGERGAPNRRYVMELTPSPSALEQTLTACGRPLVDARDTDMDHNAPDGLSPYLMWVHAPRPEYPGAVRDQIALRGSVTISCVSDAEGKPVDCVIESEHPGGFNFGREAIRALNRARVRMSDGASTPQGRMFLFTTNFIMR